jgi:CIC family chloride channel protein
VITVPKSMTFADFKDLYCQTNQEYFPVVDEESHLSGIFSNSDFRSVLFSPEIEDLVVVQDIATSDIIETTLSEDLNTVMNKFTLKNLESLPVVDEDNPQHLLGMLRRKEVIGFYNEKVKEMRQNAAANAAA